MHTKSWKRPSLTQMDKNSGNDTAWAPAAVAFAKSSKGVIKVQKHSDLLKVRTPHQWMFQQNTKTILSDLTSCAKHDEPLTFSVYFETNGSNFFCSSEPKGEVMMPASSSSVCSERRPYEPNPRGLYPPVPVPAQFGQRDDHATDPPHPT